MTDQSKVALVTGAGTGVGKAVAQMLLQNGYCVTLTGRRGELLEAAASESDAGSDAVLCHAADLRHSEEVDRLFDAVIARFGRIDLFSTMRVSVRVLSMLMSSRFLNGRRCLTPMCMARSCAPGGHSGK